MRKECGRTLSDFPREVKFDSTVSTIIKDLFEIFKNRNLKICEEPASTDWKIAGAFKDNLEPMVERIIGKSQFSRSMLDGNVAVFVFFDTRNVFKEIW